MKKMNAKKATRFFVIVSVLSVLFLVLEFVNLGINHTSSQAAVSLIFLSLWVISIFVFMYAAVVFFNAYDNSTKNTEFVPEDMKDFSDLPEYTGRSTFFAGAPSLGILYGVLFLIILFMVSALYNTKSTADDISSLIVGLGLPIAVYLYHLIKYLTHFMRITEEGICFYSLLNRPKMLFKWENIKSIGISKAPGGPGSVGFLYVSTRETKEIVKIQKYAESKIRVMIAFRPSAVHCILKYYDGHINYLGNNKGWQRYVLNLRGMPLDSYQSYDADPASKLKVKIMPASDESIPKQVKKIPNQAIEINQTSVSSAEQSTKAQPKRRNNLASVHAGTLTYARRDVFYFSPPAVRRIFLAITLLFIAGSISIDAYTGSDRALAWLITLVQVFITLKNYSRKMIIAKEGVSFQNYFRGKSYFFRWSDIKSVGISKEYGDEPTPTPYFYVSKEKIGEYVDITKYTENKSTVMIMFQPKAARSVQAYTRRKINNLDEQKSWQRYIKRHGKNK